MMTDSSKIPFRIINQLKNGRTQDGMVGAKVKATGDNPNNHCWLTIIEKKWFDSSKSRYSFLSYEVEYLELREEYNEEEHGYDYDEFYVKRETYYNIKNQEELVSLLKRWLDEFTLLKPVAHINHPIF